MVPETVQRSVFITLPCPHCKIFLLCFEEGCNNDLGERERSVSKNRDIKEIKVYSKVYMYSVVWEIDSWRSDRLLILSRTT